MKVAIIGSKDFDSLEFHTHDALKFLGHEVVHVDIKDVVDIPYKYNFWARKLFSKYDRYIFSKIAKRIIDEKPDLVICTYRFIHPECINLIKKNLSFVKIVQLNPDSLTTFQDQQIFVSPYDAYFTKDPFIVSFMRDKLKLNTFYLPEAFNHRIHSYEFENRIELEEKVGIDVVCFGTLYPYRAKMVRELINNGIDVKLFGTPDKKFPDPLIVKNFANEFITGSRKAEVLLGSKIVFNNFHYSEIESVNAKFFEIAGIGGFQICDYKETLKEYSGIDVNKFSYMSIDEAIEKIKYYLTKTSERHELAQIQRRHFLEHHTYDIRVKEMLSKIDKL